MYVFGTLVELYYLARQKINAPIIALFQEFQFAFDWLQPVPWMTYNMHHKAHQQDDVDSDLLNNQ